jgi:hypothetical protein
MSANELNAQVEAHKGILSQPAKRTSLLGKNGIDFPRLMKLITRYEEKYGSSASGTKPANAGNAKAAEEKRANRKPTEEREAAQRKAAEEREAAQRKAAEEREEAKRKAAEKLVTDISEKATTKLIQVCKLDSHITESKIDTVKKVFELLELYYEMLSKIDYNKQKQSAEYETISSKLFSEDIKEHRDITSYVFHRDLIIGGNPYHLPGPYAMDSVEKIIERVKQNINRVVEQKQKEQDAAEAKRVANAARKAKIEANELVKQAKKVLEEAKTRIHQTVNNAFKGVSMDSGKARNERNSEIVSLQKTDQAYKEAKEAYEAAVKAAEAAENAANQGGGGRRSRRTRRRRRTVKLNSRRRN